MDTGVPPSWEKFAQEMDEASWDPNRDWIDPGFHGEVACEPDEPDEGTGRRGNGRR